MDLVINFKNYIEIIYLKGYLKMKSVCICYIKNWFRNYIF